MTKNKYRDVAELAELVTIYSQDAGKEVPLKLTGIQRDIFNTIVQRRHPRVHCMTITRYGKSMTVGAAVLTRCMTHPGEKWAIIAPSTDKAMIIMKYVIDFCMSNEIYKKQLDMEEGQKTRLRREVSKKRIVFKNNAQIFVLSADSRNKQAAGEALMGFGSSNIILDESSLISDDIYAKIFRMLGDSRDNFMFEIGNPFYRNHFYKNFHNDRYFKIVADYQVSLDEGRVTEDHISEMREKAFFDVLYECKFPDQAMVDQDGWTPILTDEVLTNAIIEDNPNSYGELRIGLDIARSGGNFNVWVLRSSNYARILGKTTSDNLMDVIGQTKHFAEEYNITEDRIYIDATGMGAGVYDRLRETGWNVRGLNMASKPQETDKYFNLRAEIFMRAREWFINGGTIDKDSDFYQLLDIKYKTRSNGKIQIIGKEILRKEGILSPDVADALALTFGDRDESNVTFRRNKIKIKQNKQPKYE